MDRVAEKIKSKYPEENELEGFVAEKKVKFDEMKEAVKAIADKIKSDAQNKASESDGSAGFYTQMFKFVLKEKILTFLNVCIH